MQKLYTTWATDEQGQKVKLWRIGKTKYYPAFKWVSELKFLGIKASYGHFEMQTLTFRISEAKQKLRQVRKFVYNRRVASTVSRLRVWLGTVWPTLSFGLAEVGLSDESACALQSWYAFKIRSVLNKPSHISHMPTKDLFELYSIEDPITKLEKLQANRLRNLEAQSRSNPNITNSQRLSNSLEMPWRSFDSTSTCLIPKPQLQTLAHRARTVSVASRPSMAFACVSPRSMLPLFSATFRLALID